MEIPMMDVYLDTLAGYVRDEDKLVTYKWLSKELEVHVNIAKLILWRYWNQNKSDKLVATLMLIGNLKGGGMRVEVVKDCDAAKAKDKFEKIISEHVYSLQKTLPVLELLAGSGKGDSRYSAIACEKSVIYSEEELLVTRWGKAINLQGISNEKKAPASSTEKKPPLSIPSKNETSPIEETPKNAEKSNGNASKTEENSKKVSPPTKQKNEKKGAIPKKPVQSTKAGFGQLFGKAGNQPKNQAASSSSGKVTEANSRKNSSDSSPDKIPPTSAAENLSDKARSEANGSNSKSEMKVLDDAPEEKEIPSRAKKIRAEEIEQLPESKKTKSKKNTKSQRGPKRKASNEDSKKRKRILIPLDSSDESAAESENEDMFESPPPQPPKRARSPSPSPADGKKRKVRKLVDKTFLDEDGYLVTKKESVYESCSEPEEPEVEEIKKSEPEKPKEPKANAKKKQTSLMSFFKKG